MFSEIMNYFIQITLLIPEGKLITAIRTIQLPEQTELNVE